MQSNEILTLDFVSYYLGSSRTCLLLLFACFGWLNLVLDLLRILDFKLGHVRALFQISNQVLHLSLHETRIEFLFMTDPCSKAALSQFLCCLAICDHSFFIRCGHNLSNSPTAHKSSLLTKDGIQYNINSCYQIY